MLNSIESLTSRQDLSITGSTWKKGKTYLDRFQDHLNGKGGVHIARLIEDGALKEDFQTELLCTYPKKECLEKEKELAMTSLFPKGLNGNAGNYVEHTREVRAKQRTANLGRKHSEETKEKMRKPKMKTPKAITREQEQKRLQRERSKVYKEWKSRYK